MPWHSWFVTNRAAGRTDLRYVTAKTVHGAELSSPMLHGRRYQILPAQVDPPSLSEHESKQPSGKSFLLKVGPRCALRRFRKK